MAWWPAFPCSWSRFGRFQVVVQQGPNLGREGHIQLEQKSNNLSIQGIPCKMEHQLFIDVVHKFALFASGL